MHNVPRSIHDAPPTLPASHAPRLPRSPPPTLHASMSLIAETNPGPNVNSNPKPTPEPRYETVDGKPHSRSNKNQIKYKYQVEPLPGTFDENLKRWADRALGIKTVLEKGDLEKGVRYWANEFYTSKTVKKTYFFLV